MLKKKKENKKKKNNKKPFFNINKKYKKNFKNIVIFHIFSTFNNTIITLTDKKGNTIFWSSSGNSGFKGCKKSTFYAAQTVAEKVAKQAIKLGFKNAKIFIKGIGIGRDSSIRGIFGTGINIISVSDFTSAPHNGCKPKKLRRN